MAKVGAILGIIGSSLLLLGGLISFGSMGTLEALMTLNGLTWADIGLDPMMLYVNSGMTLVWGIFGLVGAILAMQGKKIGVWLMLVFGIIASVGLFIPIATYSILTIQFSINLNGSFLFVDPFLLLLGGILGLTLKEEALKEEASS